MVAPAVEGIDPFKIAGRSISGWIPSFKTGAVSSAKQPFCSQLEERLLMWLEYHPQVASYARGDIGQAFATTYRLPIPKHAPFAIGYAFEGKPHAYLPDVVGTLTNGKLFIAEAGMEDDKRDDRNQARAEAARRLAHLQQGVFWIGTEKTLIKQRHYNLVFLHARRKTFPAKARDCAGCARDLALLRSRRCLRGRKPSRWAMACQSGRRAAIWKLVGDSLASGHLLIDLERQILDRKLPMWPCLRNLLNTLWTDVIHLFWTKNGKLVKDYMGETDIKQVICSFLREESSVVAPAKGDEAGKELLCPLKGVQTIMTSARY